MIGRGAHLGTRASALADGQLPPAEAERALAHVAVCQACAAELAAARAVRSTLRHAAQDAPTAPDDLTRRLLAMAQDPYGSGPGAGRTGSPVPPSAPRTGGGPALPSTAAPGWRPSGRAALLLVGGAGGVLTLGVLAVLGAAQQVTPSRHPSDALALLSGAPSGALASAALPSDGGGGPGVEEDGGGTVEGAARGVPSDLPAWLGTHGWAAPEDLPTGTQVVAVEHDDRTGRLELELRTSDGPVVVVQRHGLLDPAAVAGAHTVDVGGVQVHVLSTEPWHGVWQCGDTVVDVVAGGPSDALADLVSAYPSTGYDDGVPARIARGWDALVGTWTP